MTILDSRRSRLFNIISERRRPGVNDSIYAGKVVKQVDSLFQKRVPVKNIIVVGASSGADITIRVAALLKNRQMKYVIMGVCWPDTYKNYDGMPLRGHFLSIIEKTDPHGTCAALFKSRPKVSSFKKIMLNTGLSHGFLFKGYKTWIDPVVKWFNEIK